MVLYLCTPTQRWLPKAHHDWFERKRTSCDDCWEHVKNEMMAQGMCNTFKRTNGRNAGTLNDSDSNTKGGEEEGQQAHVVSGVQPARYLCLFVW